MKDFFPCILDQFVITVLDGTASKNCFFGKLLAGKYRPVIPALRECQNAQVVLSFS